MIAFKILEMCCGILNEMMHKNIQPLRWIFCFIESALACDRFLVCYQVCQLLRR